MQVVVVRLASTYHILLCGLLRVIVVNRKHCDGFYSYYLLTGASHPAAPLTLSLAELTTSCTMMIINFFTLVIYPPILKRRCQHFHLLLISIAAHPLKHILILIRWLSYTRLLSLNKIGDVGSHLWSLESSLFGFFYSWMFSD